jgi:hypothetical protein
MLIIMFQILRPAIAPAQSGVPFASKKRLSSMATLLLTALFVSFLPVSAMAVEEPKFDVLSKDGDFELRQYGSMVIAETFVSGNQDEASSKGFRAIAGYIFGDNKRAGANAVAEKIAMTAPVTIEKTEASQKIDMTAPVVINSEAGRWRVHFVMPSQYKIADLPTPNDAAVSLREIPGKKFAAVRFSGFSGEEKVALKTAKLSAWITARGLTTAASPQLARYNPPITPPFWRRNEILIEVK